MVAEQIERPDLQSQFMRPERVVELRQERYIDDNQRKRGGENQHVATVGVVAQCLFCCIEY